MRTFSTPLNYSFDKIYKNQNPFLIQLHNEIFTQNPQHRIEIEFFKHLNLFYSSAFDNNKAFNLKK